MAYVRQHGNQVAIVLGERNLDTGKVGQRILFTLYSKSEALEALGRGEPGGAQRFRSLLESKYPGIRFDWKAIREAIAANLTVLPETYQYLEGRLRRHFRKDLCAFARQVLLADPQWLLPAAQLIREHRYELEYLAGTIQNRLGLCDQQEDEWNTDNAFFWRFEMRASEVPPDEEEYAAELYKRGDFDRAEAAFRFLIDCFDDYAEGYNYLGLIALERDQLDEAISLFTRTMEVGRRLFPKHIPRKRYWTDLATRPYIRGMRNATLSLNQAGRYQEALAFCDRLEKECGDDVSANTHRAAVYLNIGEWQKAVDAAQSLHRVFPAESLVQAFALFELGLLEEAVASFLHGALNHPRAVCMLAGVRTTGPKTHEEAQDHNTGVSLQRALGGYFARPRCAGRQFLRQLVGQPSVAALLEEIEDVVLKWREEHRTDERKAFDRMQLMRTPEFARERTADIVWLLGIGSMGKPAAHARRQSLRTVN